jgi:hypothetical protein
MANLPRVSVVVTHPTASAAGAVSDSPYPDGAAGGIGQIRRRDPQNIQERAATAEAADMRSSTL